MLNWQNLISNPKLVNNGLLINGNWISNREQINVENPADGNVIATVSIATSEDITNAIDTAYIAFTKWKTTGAFERSKILFNWYQLILDNIDDLAKLITLECGKPLAEARAEILYSASYFQLYSEEIKRANGNILPLNNPKQRALVTKQPVGVCAAITPWNFPSAMLARKVAPAIAAGCAMVARPSSQTPLSALALGYLALEAGLPHGLFNVLTGDSELISKELCKADKVRKLSFTGSTEVGINLYQQSATTLKRLSLELGGNAPFIVFEDADLELAVSGMIKSKFRNAGQTCVCANRVFVAEKILDKFVALLKPKIEDLIVGDGLDVATNIGPLINSKAVEHAESLIQDALSKGAQLVCKSKKGKIGGNFFTPVVLTNCNSAMQIFKEEIFAPILAIYSFSSDDEVISLANNTPFGLASYFFTQNIKRAFVLAESLDYGMVGINTGITSGANAPFGGIKHSGFGREGGIEGLDEYMDKKYICLDLS